ncbi:ankyrin [Legionella taurinensis]|nr:ankyrin [Legionella taurinensis]
MKEKLPGCCQSTLATRPAREGEGAEFYAIEPDGTIAPQPSVYNKPEQIPIHFFNDLPSGFFTRLTSAFKDGSLTFDMASLASVLAAAYTLEEDDLHKGNFCFYVTKKLTEKGYKPHVVFMKIDHDLMMADSVMSHGHARVANWLYQKNAFSITERDLLHFPKLLDSKNHYWPTSRRLFVKPFDPKAYNDNNEITAFSALSTNPEFIRAKWQEFYKHILIPRQLIEDDVAKGFDRNNPTDCAQIALITNAVVARQARLRAVLFSIAEFRTFVETLHGDGDKALDTIEEEIFTGVDPLIKEKLQVDFKRETAFHRDLCTDKDNGFKEKDTPLHAAIRLGDYRYDETWDAFSQFARKRNQDGTTPMQLVMNQVLLAKEKKPVLDDPRKNPFFIANHLLRQGIKHAIPRDRYRQLSNYSLPSSHLNKAEKAASLPELLAVFQAIGEDERFTLKMRKDLAISALESFIKAQADNPQLRRMLLDFRKALNVDKAPQLQYIRQLRSELWIIRQIRGLLGGTHTQVSLTELVDKELAKPTLKAPRAQGVFGKTCRQDKKNVAQTQELSPPVLMA